MSSLHEAQVQQYWDRGYANRIPVLAADEVLAFRSEFDRLEQAQNQVHGGLWTERAFRPWKQSHHPFEDWFIELAIHPAVLDAVESVLGPDILVRNGDVFTRDVGGQEGVTWHVDSSRPGPEMDGMLSAWIGLSASSADNGALEFAVGSHRDGVTRGTADDLGLTPDQVQSVEAGEVALNEMEPGQMSLHHIRLAHRSKTNQTQDRRVAYVVRYMTPSVSAESAEAGMAMLARGRCPTRHFSLRANFPVSWGLDRALLSAHTAQGSP